MLLLALTGAKLDLLDTMLILVPFAALMRRFARLAGTGLIETFGAWPVGTVSMEHPESIVIPPLRRLHFPVPSKPGMVSVSSPLRTTRVNRHP